MFLLIPAGFIVSINSIQNRRLYGHSRFTPILLAMLGLSVLSIYTAPFQNRGWVLLFRPTAGMWIFSLWTETLGRRNGGMWAKTLTASVVAVVLIMGLTAIQWTGKAGNFAAITSVLPDWRSFPWWAGGFNVNEWSGAVTWILPTLIGINMHNWAGRYWRIWAAVAAILFAGLLFMGQSLSGLAGVIAGILLLVAGKRWPRTVLTAAMAGLFAANFAIAALPVQSAAMLGVLSGQPDDTGLAHRAVMWERARTMITDHPWTGVGIAMYRQLRNVYAVPGFEDEPLPHPHNEALQFGTDLGLPGLVLYGWFIVTAGQCAWSICRRGTEAEKATAMALIAGLFAHAVYGLTDAIPIWDRFAFLLWWWLGLLSGLDVRVSARVSEPHSDTSTSG